MAVSCIISLVVCKKYSLKQLTGINSEALNQNQSTQTT